jgi:hypothetical protein
MLGLFILAQSAAIAAAPVQNIEMVCEAHDRRGRISRYFFSVNPVTGTFSGKLEPVITISGIAKVDEDKITLTNKTEYLNYYYILDRKSGSFALDLDTPGKEQYRSTSEEGTCQKFTGNAF